MKLSSPFTELIEDRLGGLQIGTARTFGGLTVYPLLGDGPAAAADADPGYLTLDRALEANAIRITEVSDAGSVPTLRLENLGDRPVLLLDGEELAGAKQNRVLNLTILAPAASTLDIPVSCVEAGRWRSESRQFSSMNHVMYSGGRSSKLEQVTRALKRSGARTSDQGALWDSIKEMSMRHDVESDTSKMADVYRAKRRGVNEYVDAFAAVDAQLGAAFVLGGKVRGVEFFHCGRTLHEMYGKLVRSWALDAMLAGGREAQDVPAPEKIAKFLGKIRTAAHDASEHDAVGLGSDVRLAGKRLVGSALVHDGEVVHLCAFRTGRQDAVDGSDDDAGSRPGSQQGSGSGTGSRSGLLSRVTSRLMPASRRRGRYGR